MIVSILLVQLLLSAQAAFAAETQEQHRQTATYHYHQRQHHHQLHQPHQREQQQPSRHQSSVYDEEINLEPQYDYDKTSAVADSRAEPASSGSPQIDLVDPSSLAYADAPDSPSPSSSSSAKAPAAEYNGDPFAATFEDYLREASLASASNHMGGDDDESIVSAPSSNNNNNTGDVDQRPAAALANKAADPRYGEPAADSAAAAPASSGSASDDSIKQRETPIIDYIFPPAPSTPSPDNGRSPTMVKGDENDGRNDTTKSTHSQTASSNKSEESRSDSLLLDEIRSLFAWKPFATNKCSKPCAKGYQIKHFSCVDLKYDVRVEDELCVKSSVAKPSEISSEPCNEIDCPPEWISIEEPCSVVGNRSGGATCRGEQLGGVYKRVQCAMLDRTGAIVHLDDQKCAASQQAHHEQHHLHQQQQHLDEKQPAKEAQIGSSTRASNLYDDESVELSSTNFMSSSSIADDENYNKILALDSAPSGGDLTDQQQQQQQSKTDAVAPSGGEESAPTTPLNEPFYEASPWSVCFGDKCGQLGKRYRRLTCRIYLSRSARYADLPESSCQGAPQPDTQEPCFIDCGGARDSSSPANSSTTNNNNNSNNNADGDDGEKVDMISVVSGVHIEQKANHVLVLDTRSGRKEMISSEQLVAMPLKVLTKTMAGFPREVLARVKQLRRTLRSQRVNSPTATASSSPTGAICRASTSNNKKLEHRSRLERRNAELLEELRQKERRIAELERRILSCEFDNSILA